jgi:prepilin-type N-terminal cleavage/methylation domain-containing protein
MRDGSPSPRRAPGFTLIEIVLVLVLIALAVGGALAYMVVSDDDRALSRASVEVEALAKRARTLAALQQRPYALEFYDQSVHLMPLAEAMLDPRDRERAVELLAAAEATSPAAGSGFSPVHASWLLDGDMKLFVRRWASDDWLPADSKNRHVWRFDPEGFCEPVGVRITVGDSWVEAEFHPLTGGIRDLSKEVY